MAAEPEILSHWYNLIDGLQHSSKEFYFALKKAIDAWNIKSLKLVDEEFSEGGFLSGKRLYLRVTRGEHVFDVCAAPFGRGFFISWWLLGRERWWYRIPLLGFILRVLFKRITYYKIDTALMFQTAVHAAVLEVLDGLTTAKGIRALSEAERKPVMRDFLTR